MKLRYVIITLLLILSSAQLSALVSANPAGTNVIITEVLYDAPTSDATQEWVELFNPTPNAISLAGWTIKDNVGSSALSGSIPANGYIVIARDSTGFTALYNFAPDLVWSGLALSNSGDQVRLVDASNAEIDFVAWENYVTGWPVSAVDMTIRRITATDTDSGSDWENSGTLGDPKAGSYTTGPPPPDTTAPIVSFTNPVAAATVSGTVPVTFTATDANGIVSYELSIDGVVVSSTNSYSWDTTTTTDGSHNLLAKATDPAGNIGQSSISVTVNNAAPPPPPPTSSTAYKLMTYNVEQSGLNPDWKKVVQEENPDIVVFVEVGTWDDGGDLLMNQYLNEFNTYFVNEAPYQGRVTQGISYSTSGEAVFSRYPIVTVNQIATVTLDSGVSFNPSHDFFDVTVKINSIDTHIIGSHLKCCSGATNEDKRNKAMEGIINYMDTLGNVPIVFAGDLNSFSPFDTGSLAPKGDLGIGPMSMLVNPSDPTYGAFSSTVHTFTDVFRTLNPTLPGYTYGHQNPIYQSRIDFLVTNQKFNNLLINSTTGDTVSANTGSDHYNVDAFINLWGSSDTTPPAQVKGLTASAVSTTQIDLSWTANTEPDLASYKIYRDGVYLTSTTVTSFSDTGLTANTLYNYQVSALDTSTNEGLKSASVSATTLTPTDTTPPAQVTGLTATAISSTQIDLSWSANTEPDLANYRIYRGGVFLTTTTSTSFSDTGLTASTLYSYQISAVDTSANEGLKSTSASATTLNPADTIPPVVTIVTPTGTVSGSTLIEATITDNIGVTSTDYRIDAGVWTALTKGTGTSWTATLDTTLLADGSHTIEVRGIDAATNTGTASGTFTVSNTPPPTPGKYTFTGTVSSTSPDLVFYFDVTAAGTISASLSWPAGPDVDMFLYAPGVNVYGTGYATRAYTTANPEFMSYSTSTMGKWAIRVNHYSGSSASFTLDVNVPVPGSSKTSTFTGIVSTSVKDQVYYFDVTAVGTISATLSWASGPDVDMYLYAPGVNVYGTGYATRAYTTANPESLSFSATTTGRWAIRVNHYSGSSASFTLTVTYPIAPVTPASIPSTTTVLGIELPTQAFNGPMLGYESIFTRYL